jgi:D-proline reductase (dithiol) PrdB
VGLIQRAVEKAGITTISVSLAKGITRDILPPRAVLPGLPLGHPLGFPGRETQQIQMLRLLLRCIQELDAAGTFVEIDPSDLEEPKKIGASSN